MIQQKTALICSILMFGIAGTLSAATPQEIFRRVNDACSYNDSGVVKKCNLNNYTPAKALKSLQDRDLENRGQNCSKGRRYGNSKADGVALFKEFLKSNEMVKECLLSELSSDTRMALFSLIDSPENIGVFASLYTDANEENAEACGYYTFDIYRRDGTCMRFVFDYTD